MLEEIQKTINQLRKEAENKLTEASNLEVLVKEYPNLRRVVDRWGITFFASKDVNDKVTHYDHRFNCGCCTDSPFEIWPYLSTPSGLIYSDPPRFVVGEKRDYEEDNFEDYPVKFSTGWENDLRGKGIPESVIKDIQYNFIKE